MNHAEEIASAKAKQMQDEALRDKIAGICAEASIDAGTLHNIFTRTILQCRNLSPAAINTAINEADQLCSANRNALTRLLANSSLLKNLPR